MLQVIGVDEDVAAAQRRGLSAVQLKPLALGAGALQPELAAMGRFDAVVYYAPGSGSRSAAAAAVAMAVGDADVEPEGSLADSWWRQESLAEIRRVLRPAGRLCVLAPAADQATVRRQLAQAGFSLLAWEQLPAEQGACRMVAQAW